MTPRPGKKNGYLADAPTLSVGYKERSGAHNGPCNEGIR